MSAALERTVSSVLGDHPPVAMTILVVERHPARALLDAAAGAELFVVGSRGRGSLAGAVLGSVSLHCAAHSPCPLVIVRGDTAADGGTTAPGAMRDVPMK